MSAIDKAAFQTYGDWLAEQRNFASFDDDAEEHANWLVVPFDYCPNIATCLDDSNQAVLTAALEEADPSGETYELQRFSSWVTPYERYIVEPNSKAHETVAKCICALTDYPVLDDEDFSQREYDATLANIESELGPLTITLDGDNIESESLTGDLFTWFWENDQSAVESFDGNGGYPDRSKIEEALTALGYTYE